MGKIRKNFNHDFTTVLNTFLRDQNVNLTDRGLLLTMLSLPNNWDFSAVGLAAILPDGKSKIYESLKRLEKAGYLKRERIFTNGKVSDWDYIFSDEPIFLKELSADCPAENVDKIENTPTDEASDSYNSKENSTDSSAPPDTINEIQNLVAENRELGENKGDDSLVTDFLKLEHLELENRHNNKINNNKINNNIINLSITTKSSNEHTDLIPDSTDGQTDIPPEYIQRVESAIKCENYFPKEFEVRQISSVVYSLTTDANTAYNYLRCITNEMIVQHNTTPIKNWRKYLIRSCENNKKNINNSLARKEDKKIQKNRKPSFDQRTYDYTSLEKMILASTNNKIKKSLKQALPPLE